MRNVDSVSNICWKCPHLSGMSVLASLTVYRVEHYISSYLVVVSEISQIRTAFRSRSRTGVPDRWTHLVLPVFPHSHAGIISLNELQYVPAPYPSSYLVISSLHIVLKASSRVFLLSVSWDFCYAVLFKHNVGTPVVHCIYILTRLAPPPPPIQGSWMCLLTALRKFYVKCNVVFTFFVSEPLYALLCVGTCWKMIDSQVV